MKRICLHGRILGALFAFAALNTSALLAQTIVSPVLAAPAQSGNQPQDKDRNAQSTDQTATDTGSGSAAQGNGQHKTRWQQQTNRMRKLMDDLNMTPEQRAQVRTIIQNHRSRIIAIRRDASLTQDQKNKQLKATRMDARKKFGALLTPEQKEKLKAISAQWKKDHPRNSADSAGSGSTGSGATGQVRSAPPTPDDDDPASVLVGGDDDDASTPGGQ